MARNKNRNKRDAKKQDEFDIKDITEPRVEVEEDKELQEPEVLHKEMGDDTDKQSSEVIEDAEDALVITIEEEEDVLPKLEEEEDGQGEEQVEVSPVAKAVTKTVEQLANAILKQKGRINIRSVNSAQISFLRHVTQVLGIGEGKIALGEIGSILREAGLLEGESLMVGVGIWEFDIESKEAYEALATVFYMVENGMTIVKDNLTPKLLGNYSGLADTLFSSL